MDHAAQLQAPALSSTLARAPTTTAMAAVHGPGNSSPSHPISSHPFNPSRPQAWGIARQDGASQPLSAMNGVWSSDACLLDVSLHKHRRRFRLRQWAWRKVPTAPNSGEGGENPRRPFVPRHISHTASALGASPSLCTQLLCCSCSFTDDCCSSDDEAPCGVRVMQEVCVVDTFECAAH